jgi:hypothetical protein
MCVYLKRWKAAYMCTQFTCFTSTNTCVIIYVYSVYLLYQYKHPYVYLKRWEAAYICVLSLLALLVQTPEALGGHFLYKSSFVAITLYIYIYIYRERKRERERERERERDGYIDRSICIYIYIHT